MLYLLSVLVYNNIIQSSAGVQVPWNQLAIAFLSRIPQIQVQTSGLILLQRHSGVLLFSAIQEKHAAAYVATQCCVQRWIFGEGNEAVASPSLPH